MPDHGVRLPPYTSNQGLLGESPYGWKGTPPYRAELLPSHDFFKSDQFAYERIDWDNFQEQGRSLLKKQPPVGYFSNPPFLGASQIISPAGAPEWMRRDGKVTRILRGFMRRQQPTAGDNKSYVRLNFMWNPDEVTRQYVGAMDTNVADIANATGQNPSDSPLAFAMVNATFTLFFDRQAEVAIIPDHPGVLVDLQAFDVMAGNVAATGTKQYNAGGDPDRPLGSGVPDPGAANVDMVPTPMGQTVALTPTLVTAVFSPSLAFYGVLTGATATFTKFSHRMVPTAMQLTLTLNLVGVGNLNRQNYEANALIGATSPRGAQPFRPELYVPGSPGYKPPTTPEEIKTANEMGPPNAVNWGLEYIGSPYTYTNRMDGPPCNNKDFQSDCSSFVYRCYKAINWTEMLGLGNSCSSAPNTKNFEDTIKSRTDVWESEKIRKDDDVQGRDICRRLKIGDILVRGATSKTSSGGTNGHIIMFAGTSDGNPAHFHEANCFRLHSTGGGGPSNTYGAVEYGVDGGKPETGRQLLEKFNYWARPKPYR